MRAAILKWSRQCNGHYHGSPEIRGTPGASFANGAITNTGKLCVDKYEISFLNSWNRLDFAQAPAAFLPSGRRFQNQFPFWN
jgi:hypothetical protein